jgi:hypothetical protein
MRLLRRPFIQPQIIPARGIQPLMPQQLLDMADGPPIQEQRGRHGMAENVRGDVLHRSGFRIDILWPG